MNRQFLENHKLTPRITYKSDNLESLIVYFDHNKSKKRFVIYSFDPFTKSSVFDKYDTTDKYIKELCQTHDADALFLKEEPSQTDLDDLAREYYEKVYMKIERKEKELKV